MFTVALFVIAQSYKQPKGPSTGEWINRLWHNHTMECYSVVKWNELMICNTMYMNLKIIMLKEAR